MTYGDFCRLPVMTKAMIQATPDLFRSAGFAIDELLVEYTSGSTGVPFRSYKTVRDVNASTLALWGARRRLAPGVVGTRGAAFYAFREQKERLVTSSVHVSGEMLYLSLFHMKDKLFEQYWKALIEFQPNWIVGTPTAVSQLADYAVRKKRSELGRVQIQLTEIGGEIAFPGQYRVIREAFGCPVSMHYGARELWPIAYSCKHGSLHIVDHHVFVEVLRPDGTPCLRDERGHVHVTSLRYEGAPLIRYDLGDLARLSPNPCGCGHSAPVLLLDGGRAAQYIVRRDGSEVSPVILFFISKKLFGRDRLGGRRGGRGGVCQPGVPGRLAGSG